jgi:hypothetical protein
MLTWRLVTLALLCAGLVIVAHSGSDTAVFAQTVNKQCCVPATFEPASPGDCVFLPTGGGGAGVCQAAATVSPCSGNVSDSVTSGQCRSRNKSNCVAGGNVAVIQRYRQQCQLDIVSGPPIQCSCTLTPTRISVVFVTDCGGDACP